MAIACPASMAAAETTETMAATVFVAAVAVVSVVFLGIVGLLMLNHVWPLLLMKLDLPKGTFGWPLLGHTLSFLKPHPSNSLGIFLSHHCSRYGKVFKTHLFMSPTIVSCDEELNYFILQNEGKVFECSYPKNIHGVLGGSSMLVAVGETHKRLRNVSLSLVSIAKTRPSFLLHIQLIALQILRSWAPKSFVIFSHEARKFTFGVIAKQVLGLTEEEAEEHRILENFMTFMRGLISLPLYIPGTPYARAVKARERISSTVKSIIEKRRHRRIERQKMEHSEDAEEAEEKEEEDSQTNDKDFLDILLDIDNLSDDEKVSFVLDSLLGGYETTSLLMSMVVHFLGRSPQALEQLKMEHENIRSTKGRDEFLTWDDYRKMHFTHNVINEGLRCGNIVKFVHRKALKDVKFKGYVIPAGWKVLPVFTAVHLDPSLHEHAHKFHPWRWENQDQTCKKFTPFGGGSRCCPGSELARVEVAFFLHYLVQSFRWRIEEEDEPMAYPYVEFKRGLVLHIEQTSTRPYNLETCT